MLGRKLHHRLFSTTRDSITALSKRSDLSGKRVLVRADLNVPLSKKDPSIITDDTRIVSALPTLKLLQENNAKIVLCSHLGRPKGKVVDSMRLDPVAKRLRELFPDFNISKVDDCIGPNVTSALSNQTSKDIVLLENLRFHPEEEQNNATFAQELAQSVDVFVNDAFGTAHRAHASTAGITNYVEHSVAGLLLEKELEYLEKTVETPKRPLLAIIGGAKVSSKLPVCTALLEKCDRLILGGGMIFTFYKAMGYPVGDSMIDPTQIEWAKDLMAKAGEKLILPKDLVIADAFDPKAQSKVIKADKIPDGWMGLDIGPETIAEIQKEIQQSQTILWNGPMGVFEFEQFAAGTNAVAELMAKSPATTIIGGGDSVAAVTQCGVADQMSHISTGGGASLELLEGKVLPGVDALDVI